MSDTQNDEKEVVIPKEIPVGSIEVSQETLDKYPHLSEKFGVKVGDVITEDRLNPETEVPAFAPEAKPVIVEDEEAAA